ncbi:MAG: DUF1338 domain-containing protein, partial [Pseudomonas graminis]
MTAFQGLFTLVASTVGQPAAAWLEDRVEVPQALGGFSWSEEAVHRVWLAEALNLCLFHKLVEAV